MGNENNDDLLRAILPKLDRGGCPDRQWPDGRGEYWPLCPFPEHGGDHEIGSFHVSKRGYTCHACGAKGGLHKLAKHLGVNGYKGQAAGRLGEVVATYDYKNSAGRLVFQVLRYRPKDFRQRRPDGAGGWIWNLDGVQRVLYRLPELLAADPATIAFVVEGEKDADRLHSLGLLATTNAQGAGKWRPAYAEALRGRPVVILPDNDAPGEAHAQDVARSLFGVAASVKAVNLPGLPAKGDVSDWLQDGHTVAELQDLCKAAPEWTRPPQSPPEPPTEENLPDSGGIDGDFSPESLAEALEAVEDAKGVYGLAGQLANLPAAEYAIAKATLKERLGDSLNLNDLDRAVNEARRGLRRWQASLDVIITTDRPLRDISDDGLQALAKMNEPPAIFVRSGKLARVRTDEKGRPVIEEADESILRGRLARVSDWARVTEAGERHCPPPLEIVRDLLTRGAWPFPALEGITEAPCLRPDGTILDRPGYDPATQLIYHPAAGLHVPPVPEAPSGEDVARALALLGELIEGFPFVDEASRANALALVLTPALRPAIAGKVPLAMCDAPQAGTGKSLLTEVTALIATGRPAAMMNAPKDDEEWRKHITSALMTGATMVTIDNCEGTLSAAPLAMALTAPVWTDRVLGRNETVHLPQRATWVATGNNIRLGGDLPRRCFWIRLDAKMAQPWQREGFKHPQLVSWASEQRGELLWCLLTLARAWYVAGRPAPSLKPIGGFEDWCRVVGGVLENAGVKRFLGNLAEMYTLVDEEAPAWEGFLTTWHETLGEQAVTVAELVGRLKLGQPLRQALPDDLAGALENPQADFPKRLGRALKARVDKRFGSEGLHLVRAESDSHSKVARWRVAGFAGFCGDATTQSLANLPPLGVERENKGGGMDRESVKHSPQNPANPAGMGASVPVMVTSRMRRDLEAAGYTEADINKMTPADAWARLAVAGSVPSMAQASPATLDSGQSVEELI